MEVDSQGKIETVGKELFCEIKGPGPTQGLPGEGSQIMRYE